MGAPLPTPTRFFQTTLNTADADLVNSQEASQEIEVVEGLIGNSTPCPFSHPLGHSIPPGSSDTWKKVENSDDTIRTYE